jgi:hypothetical protein
VSNFINSNIENAEVRPGLNCNKVMYHAYQNNQMPKASPSVVQPMIMFSVCSLQDYKPPLVCQVPKTSQRCNVIAECGLDHLDLWINAGRCCIAWHNGIPTDPLPILVKRLVFSEIKSQSCSLDIFRLAINKPILPVSLNPGPTRQEEVVSYITPG